MITFLSLNIWEEVLPLLEQIRTETSEISKGVLESCPIYKLVFSFFHRRFFSIDEPYHHTPNPVKAIKKNHKQQQWGNNNICNVIKHTTFYTLN